MDPTVMQVLMTHCICTSLIVCDLGCDQLDMILDVFGWAATTESRSGQLFQVNVLAVVRSMSAGTDLLYLWSVGSTLKVSGYSLVILHHSTLAACALQAVSLLALAGADCIFC